VKILLRCSLGHLAMWLEGLQKKKNQNAGKSETAEISTRREEEDRGL